MTEQTQVEKAQQIVDEFTYSDTSQSHYVYVYLGKASNDATTYELIDGKCLSSKPQWNLDESQTDCVAYVGEGADDRINDSSWHPIFPSDKSCRLILTHASKSDVQQLEKILIEEFGCILDPKRPDGCLTNTRLWYLGPLCCDFTEAHLHKLRTITVPASHEVLTVSIIAMTLDKKIVATGRLTDIALQLKVDGSTISRICRGKQASAFSSALDMQLCFCYEDEFNDYIPKPTISSKHRLLIAEKLDGSDIVCGTAAEIQRYSPQIKQAGALHTVAKGNLQSAYGWKATYAN